MRRGLGPATALALSALALAGPSHADPYTPVGPGGPFDVAVDGNGAGYVVRPDTLAINTGISVCKLTPGAPGCEFERVLGDPAHAKTFVGRPHVFTEGAPNVVIFGAVRGLGTEGNFIHSTGSGALDFGPRSFIGSSAVVPTEAVYGPGDSITAISGEAGELRVQNADLSAPAVTASFDLGDGSSGPGAIGLDPAGNPVVVFLDETAAGWNLMSRVYDGSGPINSESNWSEAQLLFTSPLPPLAPALASGPSGLFLMLGYESPDLAEYYVSKYVPGAGFAPGVPFTPDYFVNDADMTQDQSGRLHIAFDVPKSTGILHTWSDDGVTWSRPLPIGRKTDVAAQSELRIAAGADHKGLVAFHPESGSVAVTGLEPSPDGLGPNYEVNLYGFEVRVGKTLTATAFVDEPATARLDYVQLIDGLKLKVRGKKRCLVETKKRRKKLLKKLGRRRVPRSRSCDIERLRASATQPLQWRDNAFPVGGTVNGRLLKPGLYSIAFTPTDLAGNTSAPDYLALQVLPKKKPKKKKRRTRR